MVVSKTKLAGLRGDRIASVKTMTTKNTMFAMPPRISSGSRIFVLMMLQIIGIANTAHASKVPCHG